LDTVEAEVRELVRHRGLDPFADSAAVRRLVDEVVTDYDERSLTSSLPPCARPTFGGRGRSTTRSPASGRSSDTSTTLNSKKSGSTSG